MRKIFLFLYSWFFETMYATNGIIPTWIIIKIQYWISTKEWINLEHPVGYAQKMQWIKAYYRNPLYIKCSDKFTVREYIKEKGFESILPPVFGVYNKPNEIDFSTLPDSFVLKMTTGSGNNIFVSNKNDISEYSIKKILEKNLEKKLRTSSGETQYLHSKPRIICEPYLAEKGMLPADYKFYCCNGSVVAINYGPKRNIINDCKMYIMNMDLNDISADHTMDDISFIPPKHFDEMIFISQELSKGFPFVRVDFYETGDVFYFSELTFTPSGGTGKYITKEADLLIGEKIQLDKRYYSKSGKWIY